MTNEPMYLLEKRGLFYRPNAQGYTGLKSQAGRFTLDEVAERGGLNGPDGPTDGITFWKEEDAPTYSSKCAWDLRLTDQAYWKGYNAGQADRRVAQKAEIEQLQGVINAQDYDYNRAIAERDAAATLIKDMLPYCVARYSMTVGTIHQTERLRVRANGILGIRAHSKKD